MPKNQCGLAKMPNKGKLNKTQVIMKIPTKRMALRDIFLVILGAKNGFPEEESGCCKGIIY